MPVRFRFLFNSPNGAKYVRIYREPLFILNKLAAGRQKAPGFYDELGEFKAVMTREKDLSVTAILGRLAKLDSAAASALSNAAVMFNDTAYDPRTFMLAQLGLRASHFKDA